MKPGVGNLELREIDHLLTEEENIQVKGPRTPPDLADTAEPTLYLETKIKQLERAQPGFTEKRPIDKPFLVDQADRIRTVKGRYLQDAYVGMVSETFDGLHANAHGFPLIASKTHQNPFCSDDSISSTFKTVTEDS